MATTVRQAYTYQEAEVLVETRKAVRLSPTLLCTRHGIYELEGNGLLSAIAYGRQDRCRDQAGHNREYEDGKWLYC